MCDHLWDLACISYNTRQTCKTIIIYWSLRSAKLISDGFAGEEICCVPETTLIGLAAETRVWPPRRVTRTHDEMLDLAKFPLSLVSFPVTHYLALAVILNLTHCAPMADLLSLGEHCSLPDCRWADLAIFVLNQSSPRFSLIQLCIR